LKKMQVVFTATLEGNATGCGGTHAFKLDRPGQLKLPLIPLTIGLHLDTHLTLPSKWQITGVRSHERVLLTPDQLNGSLSKILQTLGWDTLTSLEYDLPLADAYYKMADVVAHKRRRLGDCERGLCTVQIKWVGYALDPTFHPTKIIWPDRASPVTHACPYFRSESAHHKRWHTAQVAALSTFSLTT
jgi:hypothetical protein